MLPCASVAPFELGSLRLHPFGVLVGLGVFTAYRLAVRNASERGLDAAIAGRLGMAMAGGGPRYDLALIELAFIEGTFLCIESGAPVRRLVPPAPLFCSSTVLSASSSMAFTTTRRCGSGLSRPVVRNRRRRGCRLAVSQELLDVAQASACRVETRLDRGVPKSRDAAGKSACATLGLRRYRAAASPLRVCNRGPLSVRMSES
jgi:hypothetical protein